MVPRIACIAAILASAALFPALAQDHGPPAPPAAAPSPMTSEQRYKARGLQAGPPTLVARYGADDLRSGQ